MHLPASPRASREHAAGSVFSERRVWQHLGEGWRQLHGDYQKLGLSLEWHDFTAKEITWSRSFHPGSLEICLNLSGHGFISDGKQRLVFTPMTAGFYCQAGGRLSGKRSAGERHQFLTVELSRSFLRTNFSGDESNLHPIVQGMLKGDDSATVSDSIRLSGDHRQLINSLRHPPVFADAQALWYRAKALEIMVAILFYAPPEKEFFCHRQKRLSQERVDRVIAILQQNPAEPPLLEDLGRQVGCSSYYLSRIFSRHMGQTIAQYIRQLRMERAASLLRAGKMNVTEVAMAVGYSSSSHFSTAFHETFGCCPGLYPVVTPTQRPAGHGDVPQMQ